MNRVNYPNIAEEGRCARPGKYRGIAFLSHIIKLLERTLDGRIRKRVEQEFGEEQQGFRKGKGKTDWMFALRQLVEKRLEMQGRMAMGFVDLLRKMVYADDLAKIAENKQELQEVLEEWKGAFKKHGRGLDTRERS